MTVIVHHMQKVVQPNSWVLNSACFALQYVKCLTVEYILHSRMSVQDIGLEVLIVDDSPVKASEELWADVPW